VADPSLAVVIVSHNSSAELDDCLGSLICTTDPASTSVTVVDNASTDDTVARLRSRWPEVQLIEAQENVGFARANNLGIRGTQSEFVLLLNPDTIVRPGSVRTLAGGLAARPDAAAAGPRLTDEQGVAELSFGWTISPMGELRQKLVGGLHRRGFAPVSRRVDGWSRTAGEREWISGAAMLLRRADLEAVGLLDERYFMYTEDVDLCLSLRARGRKILFIPQAEVVHLRGRSAGRNPATDRLRRRSQLAYYEKHHPAWAPWLRLYLRLRRVDYTD
jgi:GT2 family glycosyltransferase